MAEKFQLVPDTGSTLEIAHSIGLIQIALLTALAEHSPEVLSTMQDYLVSIKLQFATCRSPPPHRPDHIQTHGHQRVCRILSN